MTTLRVIFQDFYKFPIFNICPIKAVKGALGSLIAFVIKKELS